MSEITISNPSLKFSKTLTTSVAKVITSGDENKIILDSHPDIEISLGDQKAKKLGLKKDMPVSLTPGKGKAKGSYTLSFAGVETVASVSAPKEKKPVNKGASPLPGMMLSNNLR